MNFIELMKDTNPRAKKSNGKQTAQTSVIVGDTLVKKQKAKTKQSLKHVL